MVSALLSFPLHCVNLCHVRYFYRKTIADTSEEEGPFLPRPAPTAPYPYGSPAVYGQSSHDYVPLVINCFTSFKCHLRAAPFQHNSFFFGTLQLHF